MDTTDIRNHATYLLSQAEEALKDGNVEEGRAKMVEAENAIKDADAKDEAQADLDRIKGDFAKPMNTVPVASADVAIHSLDEGGAELKASYKPPSWVKGLPAAAQPLWVQEKMGIREKEEAVFYKDVFIKYMQSPNDAVFQMSLDSDEKKAMEEGTDNEGGYFVPEEFINTVIHDTGLPSGAIRSNCTTIRVASKDGYIPTLANATWGAIAEEAAFSDQTPTVGQVAFSIKKSGGLIKVTRELLDDSAINLPSMLTQIFQEAAGRDEEVGILGGGGSTDYLGITDAASGVSDVLLAGATSIVATDLFNIFYTLESQHRANASWVMPSLISKEINGINSTSAGVHSVNDLNTPPATFLLGKGVVNSDIAGTGLATAITANAEIGVFGDFRNYYIFDRVGFSIRRNDSLYMENDQVGFFATRRGDGKVGLSAAFKILKAAAS